MICKLHINPASDQEKPLYVPTSDLHISKNILVSWESILIPLVRETARGLGLDCPPFSLEIVTPGIATVDNRAVNLSGHSLDLSVYLAMLSLLLNIPLKKHLISAAQISTRNGDLGIVGDLPLKLDACLNASEISTVIICDHTLDSSFKEMKPNQYSDYQAACKGAAQHLQIQGLIHVSECFAFAFESDDLIIAALKSNFWNQAFKTPEHIQTLTTLLGQDQLMLVIEDLIIGQNFKRLGDLLQTFVQWHLRHEAYPSHFGRELLSLLSSLPTHLFHDLDWNKAIPKQLYIKLIQHAKDEDMEDVSLLHTALYDLKSSHADTSADAVRDNRGEGLLGHLLSKLDDAHLNQLINAPFNNARASFMLDRNTVQSSGEFLDILERFTHHLTRRVPSFQAPVSRNFMGAKVIEMIGQSFGKESGVKIAYDQAKSGRQGGLRTLLDKITEDQISLAKNKHILATFTRSIDSGDEKIKLGLVNEMFEAWSDILPSSILEQSPHLFMDSYEKIIWAWIESKARFQSTIDRL